MLLLSYVLLLSPPLLLLLLFTFIYVSFLSQISIQCHINCDIKNAKQIVGERNDVRIKFPEIDRRNGFDRSSEETPPFGCTDISATQFASLSSHSKLQGEINLRLNFS